MKQFLNQFVLSPMQRIDFEMFIFGQASQMIKGYNGGQWESRKFGDVFVLNIPAGGDTVTVNNYVFGGEITTDHLTASVIFCSMVTNWYMGLRAEQGRFTDANIESFSEYGERLKDHSGKLPDHGAAFFRFID